MCLKKIKVEVLTRTELFNFLDEVLLAFFKYPPAIKQKITTNLRCFVKYFLSAEAPDKTITEYLIFVLFLHTLNEESLGFD